MSRHHISETDAQQSLQSYLTKRTISAAHGSSIRKLIRGNRIGAGLRPLHVSRRKERVLAYVAAGRGREITHELVQAFDLHPTKGVRNQRVFTREVA